MRKITAMGATSLVVSLFLVSMAGCQNELLAAELAEEKTARIDGDKELDKKIEGLDQRKHGEEDPTAPGKPKSCSVTVVDPPNNYACCKCEDDGSASCKPRSQSDGDDDCQSGGRNTSECSISC